MTFAVHYLITCYEGESIDEKIQWICLEQSVELPESAVPASILKTVVGQPSDPVRLGPSKYQVKIEWPVDNVGDDRTQFLNMLYGNISLKRGIKIVSVDWGSLTYLFNGPKWGIDRVRSEFDVQDRAMSCGVLKPMGSDTKSLSDLAGEFAMGGLDLIKDDHGLADQKYAPFHERVTKVMERLNLEAQKTGSRTHYFPNITGKSTGMMQRYEFAASAGASGVMVIPELCGYENMSDLADSDIDLPIIAHPAFSGTLVTDPEHGFTPAFLYGEINRAYGADFTIYPNTGGRFSFTPQECKDLNESARTSASPFYPAFPMPGGGMKKETLPKWIREYGKDIVFLLGASILGHPQGVKAASEEVQMLLKS